VTARKNLGEFEHLLLLAVLRLGEGAYGVAIKREIEGRTGRAVTLGAVYPTMDRLEARGLVTSELGQPTAERGGRSRRLFQVSSRGAEALAKAHHVFSAMWEGLDPAQLPSSE
jgi:DNA-binding PadR family transcriptional regulator